MKPIVTGRDPLPRKSRQRLRQATCYHWRYGQSPIIPIQAVTRGFGADVAGLAYGVWRLRLQVFPAPLEPSHEVSRKRGSMPGVGFPVLFQTFRDGDGNERADQRRTPLETDFPRKLLAVFFRHVAETSMNE